MKRIVGRGVLRARIPDIHWHPPGERSLFFYDDSKWRSGCWHCPDQPCLTWPKSAEKPIDTAANSLLDSSSEVCPTSALEFDETGRPRIEPARCIGCGLCVVSCPVDAIRLHAGTATAHVAPSFKNLAINLADFFEQRQQVSSRIKWEEKPWANADLVVGQYKRFIEVLRDSISERHSIMRLLTRNAFVLGGFATHIRDVGANSFSVELQASNNPTQVLAEIQNSPDGLDSFRRLLVGFALFIHEAKVAKEQVIALVVMPSLPNSRVEYYRLVKEASLHLGVSVRTITLAWLLLLIRDRCQSLVDSAVLPVVDDGHKNAGETAHKLFGLSRPEDCGIAVTK